MNDYKELIAELDVKSVCVKNKDDCKLCNEDRENCRYEQELFYRAKNAIEQLVRERDAAIADISLELVCSDVCKVCKHRFADDPTYCLECDEQNPNGNFEWRGVEEKE